MDPLVEALPPATDYLTYLTLLEYQLTPARLPLFHSLLQDETLTSNIGWDLVHLLLPMLPDSRDCLNDIARLGNPREVILRVSDALMKLVPEEEEESEEEEEDLAVDGEEPLAHHIIKFNCLVGMLGVLHSRIQTRYPSSFIATSLQAVLEAYTPLPTDETTFALVEFLRHVSPSKRPALPPRVTSESTVVRVSSKASAGDPEAEEEEDSATSSSEEALTRKYLQFALVEVLKSYILGLHDPGSMSWAIRMQEKLHPEWRMPAGHSQLQRYKMNKQLAERDVVVGKITVRIIYKPLLSNIIGIRPLPVLILFYRLYRVILDSRIKTSFPSYPRHHPIIFRPWTLTSHQKILP